MSAPASDFEFAKPTLPAKKVINPNLPIDKEATKEAPKATENKPTQPKNPATKEAENEPEPPTEPQDFHKTLRLCNNLMILVRELREFGGYVLDEHLKAAASEKVTYMDWIVLEDKGHQLEEKLRAILRVTDHLPEAMPHLKMYQMMSLYGEELFRGNQEYINTVEQVIDSSNWKEGQWQYNMFLSKFLRNGQSLHPNVMEHYRRPAPPPPVMTNTAYAAHMRYIKSFLVLETKNVSKDCCFDSVVHSLTGSGSIIEFRIFEYEKNAKTHPYILKFLLLEKLGEVRHISFRAPGEDWDTYNNYNNKLICPFTPPRDKVYDMFNKSGNLLLNESQHRIAEWTTPKLYYFLCYFAKYRKLFSMKCKSCKRHLHNYMPPTAFDPNDGLALHEPCKYIF